MTVLRREGTLSKLAHREDGVFRRIVVSRVLGTVLIPPANSPYP